MPDSTPVQSFDILSALPGPNKSWSPNTLKICLVLNYKSITYTQNYISLPDITLLLTMIDSLPIALYLEELYPAQEYPSIFPNRDESYMLTITVNKLRYNMVFAGYALTAPWITNIFDSLRGREYYIRTRSVPDMLGRLLLEKGGLFFEGKQPSLADFVFQAFIVWVKVADGDVWRELVSVGDGVVRALWDACYPWVEGQGDNVEWEIPL
ncbi:hypothetical protein BDV10DRAFT_196296 [Aspergillus recurvatus]